MNDITPHKKDFLSIQEFAKELGVHYNTIRKAIKKGRINAVRPGSGEKAAYRIPRSELQRLGLINMEKVIEKIIKKRMEK